MVNLVFVHDFPEFFTTELWAIVLYKGFHDTISCYIHSNMA